MSSDLKKGLAAASSAFGAFAILGATAKGQGKGFKVGLIGCGGRGGGALGDHMAAAKRLGLDSKVVAVADWFKDRAEKVGTDKRYDVPKDRCFHGPDAYKKLLETDVEIVLMATSPNFRPVHFEAAIKAGKHAFFEKPVCVDPPGGRRVIEAGELAKQKGLSVVAGTQRRHTKGHQSAAFEIHNGLRGKIVGGRIYWCGGALWYRTRAEGQSDADYMVANWVSFTEMSGDHIVEQHVHNIDIANWYIGRPPVTAAGFGGRARRKTGNQFDFHSVDYDYGDGCHIHSMCRQVNGTAGAGGEHFVFNTTTKVEKKDLKVPEFEEIGGATQQEHADLLYSILDKKPYLNEARNVAEASLAAVMGRFATYTGKLIKWDDMMKNKDSEWYNFTCKPSAEDFEKGTVKAPPDDVAAIPGTA
jgi:predicted dehydrogenase